MELELRLECKLLARHFSKDNKARKERKDFNRLDRHLETSDNQLEAASHIFAQLDHAPVYSAFEKVHVLFSAIEELYKTADTQASSLPPDTRQDGSNGEYGESNNHDTQQQHGLLDADALFPMIVELVDQSRIAHLPCSLKFMRLFAGDYSPFLLQYLGAPASSSIISSSSLLDYYLTHFEAAVAYLTKGPPDQQSAKQVPSSASMPNLISFDDDPPPIALASSRSSDQRVLLSNSLL